jgi:hypothetical protein
MGAMLEKDNLLRTAKGKTITVEPNGQRGCVFIMDLPLVKDGRAHPLEVLTDPWPVIVWVSFN